MGPSATNIFDNTCGKKIPSGLTIFERLNKFNPDIVTGSIYGKNTCYVPSLLENARNSISWWQDKNSYDQSFYDDTDCTNSVDVIKKSLEFINENISNQFYLFIYLGEPDCIGHKYGVPSIEYDNVLINIDNALGLLISEKDKYNDDIKIIISGDHGWELNSDNHYIKSNNTDEVLLISNNISLINNKDIKKQCDIAPTILDYFGINKKHYQDIIYGGCSSMID